jgi:uncharacterized protein (TIGR02996 family)
MIVRELSAEEAALLKAICDNPEEDTSRLVYADWLDEQGGESRVARAEFIRLQIEQYRTTVGPFDTVGDRLFATDREMKLVYQHDRPQDPDRWRSELPELPGVQFGTQGAAQGFSRGFLWQMSAASVSAFLRAAPQLYTRVPVTCLHLSRLTIKEARELAASRHLARIRIWQDVYHRRTDKMLAAIAESPHLGNLRVLDLTGAPLTGAGIGRLLAAPSLRRLTRLCLASCRDLGASGAGAIAIAPTTDGLEHLNLSYCHFDSGAARAIAAATGMRRMKELNMSVNNLDDEAAIAFAAAPWPELRSLYIPQNRIGDRGAEAILNSANLRQLQARIWLRDNPISETVRAELKKTYGDRVVC